MKKGRVPAQWQSRKKLVDSLALVVGIAAIALTLWLFGIVIYVEVAESGEMGETFLDFLFYLFSTIAFGALILYLLFKPKIRYHVDEQGKRVEVRQTPDSALIRLALGLIIWDIFSSWLGFHLWQSWLDGLMLGFYSGVFLVPFVVFLLFSRVKSIRFSGWVWLLSSLALGATFWHFRLFDFDTLTLVAIGLGFCALTLVWVGLWSTKGLRWLKEQDVEELIGALDHRSGSVRAEAAQQLGERGDPRAVMPLIKALEGNRKRLLPEGVRHKAAKALGDLGDPRAVEPLLKALEDADEGLRKAIVTALTKLSPKAALDQLIKGLESWFESDRKATVEALAKIDSPAAYSALAWAALIDGDAEVRRAAREGLDEKGRETAAPICQEALKVLELEIRLRAVELLGEWGSPLQLSALAALLKDTEPQIRVKAAFAMAEIGDPYAIAPLVLLLRDPNSSMRETAVKALGNLEDSRTLTPLTQALQDPEEKIPRFAVRALAKLGEPATASLTQALEHKDNQVRIGAVKALGEFTGQPAQEALIGALSNQNTRVRSLAVQALGRWGYESAVEPLLDALADPAPSVRTTAVEALGQLYLELYDPAVEAPWLEPVWAALVEGLKDGRRQTRKSAALAVGNIGRREAVEPLLRRLSDHELEVKKAAVWALGELGDTRAEEALLTLFDRGPKEVRSAAKAKFPLNLACPQCQSRIKVSGPGKFRCPFCRTVSHMNPGGLAEPTASDFKDRTDPLETGRLQPALAQALAKLGGDRAAEALETRGYHLEALWAARDVEGLLKVLDNKKSKTRHNAATALGYLGAEEAVDPLCELLNDQSRRVRANGAEALGRLGDLQAVGPLVEALTDGKWQVRQEAATALSRLVTAERAFEVGQAEEPDSATLAALQQRLREPLEAALHDNRAEVRIAVRKAVSKLVK